MQCNIFLRLKAEMLVLFFVKTLYIVNFLYELVVYSEMKMFLIDEACSECTESATLPLRFNQTNIILFFNPYR
jgi:hypothetical protein